MTLDPSSANPAASPDGLGPLHLAYLAAAVLLPMRLAILVSASRAVPRLHARTRDHVASGELDEAMFLRSSNPYTNLSRVLLDASRSGSPADELRAVRERAIAKIGRRNLRSQALDAISLMLLLGLSLRGEHGIFLGELAAWGAAFIGLMLLCTIFARGSLQHRLDMALRELENDLRARPLRPSRASTCAFCSADVDTAEVAVTAHGATSIASGAVCRSCGKVVASLRPEFWTEGESSPGAEGRAITSPTK